MGDLVEALKQLPEVRLRIIDWAWKLAKEDGQIDVDQAALNTIELDEAVKEAKAYIEGTRRATWCLKNMGPS